MMPGRGPAPRPRSRRPPMSRTPPPRGSDRPAAADPVSTGPDGAARADDPDARRLARTARLLDSSIRLPGGYRIGWDGIIGLIPGVGDLAGLALSGWILFGAARLGVPRRVLARMGANVGLEALVGTVPVLGDLFDFAFKANERNVRLAQAWLEDPVRARRRSGARLALAGLAVLGLLLALGWAVVAIVSALFSLAFG